MAQIFFSYSKKDRERVLPIIGGLEDEGYTVWWDDNLLAGEEWTAEIEAQITACECVVVAWSGEAVASRWVKREARYGDNNGILVPIRIERVTPPFEFDDVQYIDLLTWSGDRANGRWRALVKAVKAKAGPPAQDPAPDTAPPRPEPRPDPEPPRAASRPRQGDVAPSWATGGTGTDKFGSWADLTLDGVTQRLRWSEPGSFMMGSPEDEEGLWAYEGPRHKVTLTKGFWLFDTPVTQALWEGVMGNNPSRFKGADRPVERVSWDDTQAFLDRINSRVPGLEFTLPTEAQWEYACRAGTDGPNYLGGADRLAELAWYDENNGRETHPVKGKAPNDWGLYDMLGNVWEWCDDGRRAYDGAPVTDPAGSQQTGSSRALRGGSWNASARGVRAAGRVAVTPDDRDDNIGFRCARVR